MTFMMEERRAQQEDGQELRERERKRLTNNVGVWNCKGH